MRKILIAAASCAAVLALGTGVVSAGGAYADLGPMTVNPDSGPAGTTFTVSGDGCGYGALANSATKAPGTFFVDLWFQAGNQAAEEPAADGSWSHEFTVPDGTSVGPYEIEAFCRYIDDGEEQSASKTQQYEGTIGSYDDGTFTVIEETSSSTEAPTTTEATTTTVVEPTTSTTEVVQTTLGTVAPTTALTVAPTSATAAAELPRTGADPTALGAIGVLAVSAGTALAARRRRRH